MPLIASGINDIIMIFFRSLVTILSYFSFHYGQFFFKRMQKILTISCLNMQKILNNFDDFSKCIMPNLITIVFRWPEIPINFRPFLAQNWCSFSYFNNQVNPIYHKSLTYLLHIFFYVSVTANNKILSPKTEA